MRAFCWRGASLVPDIRDILCCGPRIIHRPQEMPLRVVLDVRKDSQRCIVDLRRPGYTGLVAPRIVTQLRAEVLDHMLDEVGNGVNIENKLLLF
jgi:hypothetical protein